MKKLLIYALLCIAAANIDAATYEFLDNTGPPSATSLLTSELRLEKPVGKSSMLDFTILEDRRRILASKTFLTDHYQGLTIKEIEKTGLSGGKKEPFTCETGCTDDFLITLSGLITDTIATTSTPPEYSNLSRAVSAILELSPATDDGTLTTPKTPGADYLLELRDGKGKVGTGVGLRDLVACDDECGQGSMNAFNDISAPNAAVAEIYQIGGLISAEWQFLTQSGQLEPDLKQDKMLLMVFYSICTLPILVFGFLWKSEFIAAFINSYKNRSAVPARRRARI